MGEMARREMVRFALNTAMVRRAPRADGAPSWSGLTDRDRETLFLIGMIDTGGDLTALGAQVRAKVCAPAPAFGDVGRGEVLAFAENGNTYLGLVAEATPSHLLAEGAQGRLHNLTPARWEAARPRRWPVPGPS